MRTTVCFGKSRLPGSLSAMKVRRRNSLIVLGALALGIVVAWVDPYPDRPPAHVRQSASEAMRVHRRAIGSPRYIIVIDYDRPVFAHRLWVLETRSGKTVLRSRVSHAFLTGPILATVWPGMPYPHVGFGEDYELLATTPDPLDFTVVGRVEKGSGVDPALGGWEHFVEP